MIQRLIWVGGPPNGLKQRRQDVCQLAPLVWVSCHRLQIRIGILNTVESVGLKNRFKPGRFQPRH